MSQFGMNMPGGAMQRRASMNVYTALLFVAMVALGAACVYVWMQAGRVGKGEGFGRPFGLQTPNQIELPVAAAAK